MSKILFIKICPKLLLKFLDFSYKFTLLNFYINMTKGIERRVYMNYNMPNMNYYPTPNYNPQMQYPSAPNNMPQQMNFTQQMSPSQLNGKIVDSEEMVRATEVPMGSYGIFPKADMSEVFIKTWNPNGTTNITHYKPAAIEDSNKNYQQPLLEDHSDKIIDRIEQMEMKIEELFNKEQKKDKKVNLGEF